MEMLSSVFEVASGCLWCCTYECRWCVYEGYSWLVVVGGVYRLDCCKSIGRIICSEINKKDNVLELICKSNIVEKWEIWLSWERVKIRTGEFVQWIDQWIVMDIRYTEGIGSLWNKGVNWKKQGHDGFDCCIYVIFLTNATRLDYSTAVLKPRRVVDGGQIRNGWLRNRRLRKENQMKV